MKENTSALARDLFNTLNIPILCTNFEVYGDVVEVVHDYNYRLYGVEAKLFDTEFKNYNPTTTDRVFIARRGSRQLINHDEVVDFLEQRGFVTYYPSFVTLAESKSENSTPPVFPILIG